MDAHSPSSSATALLVPVRLDALALVEAIRTTIPWHRGRPDFGRDFADPEPAPFDTATPATGIHLHWHLPEALGRGRMDLRHGPDAPVDFPAAPNRWLVIRYHHTAQQAAGTAPAAAGWLVHSDYRSDNKGPGPKATSPIARDCWMGRKIDLAAHAWSEPSASYPKLTAMGPGPPAFAAFQPYCEDVFSLHDPLQEFKGPLTVSYAVIGWHATAADDPLHPGSAQDLLEFFGEPAAGTHRGDGDDGRTLLERLGWELPGRTSVPGRAVYHGAVYGMRWNPGSNSFPPRGNRPTAPDDSVKAAVGHSTADAVSALVEDSLPAKVGLAERRRRAELTRAFHSGQLEAARHGLGADGNRRLLDLAAHEQWFAPWTGDSSGRSPTGKATPERPCRPTSTGAATASWPRSTNGSAPSTWLWGRQPRHGGRCGTCGGCCAGTPNSGRTSRRPASPRSRMSLRTS